MADESVLRDIGRDAMATSLLPCMSFGVRRPSFSQYDRLAPLQMSFPLSLELFDNASFGLLTKTLSGVFATSCILVEFEVIDLLASVVVLFGFKVAKHRVVFRTLGAGLETGQESCLC